MMKEYPVFIPVDDHHIAAVVTVPSVNPRGVVVLTTGGGGAPRSQRFRLWTKVARRLGELGIASVRMEYEGVGDSTGTAKLGFGSLPVDDVRAVTTFAMSVTGTDRLGMCGNCAGARTIVHAVEGLPSCRSLVLFWLKPLASADRRSGRFSRLVRVGRWLPTSVRRLLARVYWSRARRSGHTARLVSSLRSIAPGRDLLLLETQSDLAGPIPTLVRELEETSNGHVELRGFEGTSMQAFESESDQAITVDTVVEWFEASFASPDPHAGQIHTGDEPVRDRVPGSA
jgi:hypothetical protein